jgi:hypothetical protein
MLLYTQAIQMDTNFKSYFYEKWVNEHLRVLELENFIHLVANGKRSDGTYNYCREALEQRAKELLKQI